MRCDAGARALLFVRVYHAAEAGFVIRHPLQQRRIEELRRRRRPDKSQLSAAPVDLHLVTHGNFYGFIAYRNRDMAFQVGNCREIVTRSGRKRCAAQLDVDTVDLDLAGLARLGADDHSRRGRPAHHVLIVDPHEEIMRPRLGGCYLGRAKQDGLDRRSLTLDLQVHEHCSLVIRIDSLQNFQRSSIA